jgi:hypothetical protein
MNRVHHAALVPNVMYSAAAGEIVAVKSYKIETQQMLTKHRKHGTLDENTPSNPFGANALRKSLFIISE